MCQAWPRPECCCPGQAPPRCLNKAAAANAGHVQFHRESRSLGCLPTEDRPKGRRTYQWRRNHGTMDDRWDVTHIPGIPCSMNTITQPAHLQHHGGHGTGHEPSHGKDMALMPSPRLLGSILTLRPPLLTMSSSSTCAVQPHLHAKSDGGFASHCVDDGWRRTGTGSGSRNECNTQHCAGAECCNTCQHL